MEKTKKRSEYLAPEVKVIEIKSCGMLCASTEQLERENFEW